jgi:hypothetical protein
MRLAAGATLRVTGTSRRPGANDGPSRARDAEELGQRRIIDGLRALEEHGGEC